MSDAYIFDFPNDYPMKKVACYDYDVSPNRYQYIAGKIVVAPDKPLVFDITGPLSNLAGYDNIPNNTLLPLVGPRLRALFNEHCPDDVQYLETVIRAKDGSTKDYKAVNITHEVPAVDLDLSVCDYMTDEKNILGFRRLVLLENCLGEHMLARAKEYHSHILASQQLRDLLKQYKIKGACCITTDDATKYG